MTSLDHFIASHPEHFSRFSDVFKAESARMIAALRGDFSECEFEVLHGPQMILIKHPGGKRLDIAVRSIEPVQAPNDNWIKWAREIKMHWLQPSKSVQP